MRRLCPPELAARRDGRYPSAAVTAAPAANESPPGAGLRALLPDELARWVAGAGAPGYRAEQIFRWLHGRNVDTLEAMTNVPPALREALGSEPRAGAARARRRPDRGGRHPQAALYHPRRPRDRVGADPRRGRARDKLTLCISSQVGCALDCRVLRDRDAGLRPQPRRPGRSSSRSTGPTALARRRPTNLVFMGMGEPLHNFDNVTRALALLAHPWGAAFSPRRITVSTVGLVPAIEKLGALDAHRPTSPSR